MMKIKESTSRILQQLWQHNQQNYMVVGALYHANSLLDENATNAWPFIFANLDQEELSKDGKPTVAEKAVFGALHSYAIYQQQNDKPAYAFVTEDQQNNHAGFFRMLGILRSNDDLRMNLDSQVQKILGITNLDGILPIIYHLSAFMRSQMPKARIDFAQLSQDFYDYQHSNDLARQIRLKWGQQYYAAPSQDNN